MSKKKNILKNDEYINEYLFQISSPESSSSEDEAEGNPELFSSSDDKENNCTLTKGRTSQTIKRRLSREEINSSNIKRCRQESSSSDDEFEDSESVHSHLSMPEDIIEHGPEEQEESVSGLDAGENYVSEEEALHVLDEWEDIGDWHDYEDDTQLPKYDFTGERKFHCPNSNMDKPLDFFYLFFTPELISKITSETNRYVLHKIRSKPLKKHSIWQKWKPINVCELQATLGVIMNMALHRKKAFKDFYSRAWVDDSSFFRNIFSRRRIMQIFSGLHVSPPAPEGSSMYETRRSKVAAVLDYISEKFLEVYSPGKELSSDESTVPFKGRVSFRSYIANKPTKWGLRIYDLADAATGYMLAAVPYFGKGTFEHIGNVDRGVMTRIILALTEKVIERNAGKRYHVFTDRLYTSLELARELGKRGVHLTGTIQPNRKGLPAAVRGKKLKLRKGESKSFLMNRKYHLLSWRDKRTVTMLSTFHDRSRQSYSRKRNANVQEVISKPQMVLEYTKNMGGVDRHDHFVSSYAFLQKSLKWWKKLFFFLMEMALVNSFILFNMHRDTKGLKPLKHKTFRRILIQDLVGDTRNANKRGRLSTVDAEERLNGKTHFLDKFPGRRSKECLVCSDRNGPGGRKETVFYCETCTRHPPLHPVKCFKVYHTQKKLKT